MVDPAYNTQPSLDVLAVAPRSTRAWAFVVDLFVMSAVQFFGAYLGGVVAATVLAYREAPSIVVDQSVISGMVLGWTFWGLFAFVINYGIFQGFTGSSVGKFALGTRVIRRTGGELGVLRSLARTVFYVVSFGKWHDSIFKTAVVLRGYQAQVIALPSRAESTSQKAA